jgi:hypothetical protein
MKIHGLATTPHYARHVKAVWKHLPDDVRGEFRNDRRANDRGWSQDDVVMVGGFYDAEQAFRHRVIYVEHGAGQSYGGDPISRGHPCYAGGKHPDRVIGYVSPRRDVAESWGAPGFAAGCPALDEVQNEADGTVVLTFHWDAHSVCSEARSAVSHYQKELPAVIKKLESSGFKVVGHWHPRDRFGRKRWEKLGVSTENNADVLLSKMSLLIADNTSLMYEAALLGVPVLVLNAPWYRRDVKHGLRFWDHVPGIQIDEAEHLLGFDFAGYVGSDDAAKLGTRAALYAYGDNVGGVEAARWVTDLLSTM